MKEYLKARLAERSTWFGIGLLFSAFGIPVNSEVLYALYCIVGGVGIALPSK